MSATTPGAANPMAHSEAHRRLLVDCVKKSVVAVTIEDTSTSTAGGRDPEIRVDGITVKVCPGATRRAPFAFHCGQA